MPNFPPPEKLAKKGYKVIYMTDKTDDDEVEQLRGCDDYKLRCCEKIGLQTDATQEAENKFEELKAEFAPLQKLIDEILHDRVDKLVLHQTFCLGATTDSGQYTAAEYIIKAQALREVNEESE